MFSNFNVYDASIRSANNNKQSLFSNPPGLFQNSNQGSSQYSSSNRQSVDGGYADDMSVNQQGFKNFEENSNNFKVMVRVRPPLPRELEAGQLTSTIQLQPDNKRLTIYEYYNIDACDPANQAEYLENTNMYTTHNFTFDRVYNQDSSQSEVYDGTAKPAVMSVLQGYNATILAYGQTGTGKTFTMEGFKFNCQDSQRGIVPRSMEEIFKYIENVSNSKTTFMVRVSYLQIYNEVVSDLLRTDRTNLQIREDKKRGVFVEGLSEWAVRSPNEIYSLIQKGALSRATAATKMNDVSSRSHAVFIIIVEQMITTQDDSGQEMKEIRVGKLNLVDLAGSERVRVTGATGKRLEECKKINQSLSALGNVISALADMKQAKTHIPYRDSKITRLLEDSLGGNCITTMMAMVSPTVEAFGESLSTLKFANRAKNIKNAPIINEDVDQKALLRKYENELKRLKSELEERNKVHDRSKVSQLEEDKKRAERDKVAAFEALEAQSREFLMEREEKKKLEEKIRAMFSQMIVGGKKVEETPQFRTALEQQQKLIRQQYEQRLQDLEKERQMIEEDKAQVDRYKQLLLKQRDIMIALTTRLNERDETIVQLQEELDAYDRIHRETEDMLEMREKRVQELEGILRENGIPFPQELKVEGDMNEPILRNLSDKPYNNEFGPDGNDQRRYSELLGLSPQPMQGQSDCKASQYIENLQLQLNEMAERARKSEQEQFKLREMLIQKDEQIKSVNKMNGAPKDENLWFLHKEIKSNVDYIIESLSSQNEPQRLQDVARDLLNLQNLVNSVVGVDEPSESTASRSGTKYTPEVQSAGIPIRPSDMNVMERLNEEKREQHRSHSLNRGNSDSNGDQNGSLYLHNTRHASSNLSETPTAAGSQLLKEQSENIAKSQAGQRSPMRGGAVAEKRPVDNKSGENKRSISTGIFGKYMGNLVNLDPERKPMSVEEMLRMKRDQPAKKK